MRKEFILQKYNIKSKGIIIDDSVYNDSSVFDAYVIENEDIKYKIHIWSVDSDSIITWNHLDDKTKLLIINKNKKTYDEYIIEDIIEDNGNKITYKWSMI